MPEDVKKSKPVKKKSVKKKKESDQPKKIELKDFKPDHQNFILEYIRTGNKVKSYMFAYPKSKYGAASVNSFKLLENARIKEYIQSYYDELWSDRKNERSKAFNKLLRIANADIADVVEYEEDGMRVKPFSESDTFLIAEIKETVSETMNGTNVNRSVKLKDSSKAISELVRVLGMITDKVEHSGTIEIVPAKKPEKGEEKE
jgi:phage terminase small subunit